MSATMQWAAGGQKRVLGFMFLASLLLQPFATCGEGGMPPNLVGTWEGRSSEIRGDQRMESDFRIEIARQDGELLWAYDVWHPTNPDGSVPATYQRDSLLGSVNPDGTGGVLAKEDARFAFRLLDENRMEMELVAIRQDNPSAFTAVLHRVPAEKEAEIPDLTGTWRGAYRYPTVAGPMDDVFQWDILRQDAECLWVDDVWHPLDPATGKPGDTVVKDRLVGAFGPDGKRGVLVKPDARFAFRVLDENRLAVEFARVGGTLEKSTAFYVMLQRDGLAELAEAANPPALAGAWEGICRPPEADGAVTGPCRLEFTKQDGALLWADNVWHLLDPVTGKPGAESVRDPMVGSLHPDGTSGILVKAGAQFAFKILTPDRLQVEFTRFRAAGQPALAFHGVLNRVE